MKQEPYNVQIYKGRFPGARQSGNPPGGKSILDYCATNAGHAFEPSNGEELTDAYRAIAQSISDLRITR